MPRHYEQVMGVYFDDLDPFGILHNARYLLLFERTLGSFWQNAPQTQDHSHVVRANRIEYLKPFHGTGQVRVRVWVEAMGRTSMTFGFRLMPMDEDVDYAVGERVVVCVDPSTWRPTAWSDDYRALMAEWVTG